MTKINFTKSKITTSILGALFVGLILVSPTVVNTNVSALTESPQLTAPVRIAPAAPTAVGCYHWTKETGWLPITCMSDADVKKLGLADEGNSIALLGGQEFNQNTLNFGLVQVNLSTYTCCETDTVNGNGAFSIQTNTNTFQDKNSKTGWVQFLFQNLPASNVAGTCIEQWENGVNIAVLCAPVPVQTLAQGYNAYVDGSTNSGAGTITVNYCSSQCWAKTDTDKTGLAGRWNQVTGTVLGESNGGKAKFTSPTVEFTTVQAGAPSAFSYGVGSQAQTAEQNNLSYVSSYTSTSCSGSTCTTYTKSTN